VPLGPGHAFNKSDAHIARTHEFFVAVKAVTLLFGAEQMAAARKFVTRLDTEKRKYVARTHVFFSVVPKASQTKKQGRALLDDLGVRAYAFFQFWFTRPDGGERYCEPGCCLVREHADPNALDNPTRVFCWDKAKAKALCQKCSDYEVRPIWKCDCECGKKAPRGAPKPTLSMVSKANAGDASEPPAVPATKKRKAPAAKGKNVKAKKCKLRREEEEEEEEEEDKMGSSEEEAEEEEEEAEEEEEEEEEEEAAAAAEDEEAEEGLQGQERGADDGWNIEAILSERWILDKKGAGRQYELLYKKYKLPKTQKWRDADDQDKSDMPKEVLTKWRVDNPAVSVRWIKGGGVTSLQLQTAKDKHIASLSTARVSSLPAARVSLSQPAKRHGQHASRHVTIVDRDELGPPPEDTCSAQWEDHRYRQLLREGSSEASARAAAESERASHTPKSRR
jgi:hypothetical protein